MTKRSKTPPRDTKLTRKEPEDAAALVDAAVVELRAQLDVIRKRREQLEPGHFDPDLASAASTLVRVILRAEAERRAQRAAASKLDSDAVCAWLAEADGDDRKLIAEHIENLSGGSLL